MAADGQYPPADPARQRGPNEGEVRVGPAVSSREQATRIRLEGPFSTLSPWRIRAALLPSVHAAISIGYTRGFFSAVSYTRISSETTPTRRERFHGGRGITTSRIVISRRKHTPTRYQ